MKNNPRKRSALWLLGGLLLFYICGCACLNSDNRILLNEMDEIITPESTAAKIALTPVFIPAGTIVLATDTIIVHPARMAPKAADDVYDLYWKPRDMDFFRKSLLFVPIVILTPPTFLGDWLARSLFDITR